MRRCATTAPSTTTASCAHLARAQDRDRRRHHQRNAVAAGERAEIRQHQGEVAQILRRDAALVGGSFLREQGRPQIVGRLVLDVAQHRHDQAARRIDGDREIDVLEQNARVAGRIVPGVQRWLGATGADHGAHEPQHVIAAARPRVDVGIVAHGAQGDLIARLRHAVRHGAPRAAQRLGAGVRRDGRARRLGRRETASGGCLHLLQNIVQLDQSAGAAARNVLKIEPKASRERARHRHRAAARAAAAVAVAVAAAAAVAA